MRGFRRNCEKSAFTSVRRTLRFSARRPRGYVRKFRVADPFQDLAAAYARLRLALAREFRESERERKENSVSLSQSRLVWTHGRVFSQEKRYSNICWPGIWPTIHSRRNLYSRACTRRYVPRYQCRNTGRPAAFKSPVISLRNSNPRGRVQPPPPPRRVTLSRR